MPHLELRARARAPAPATALGRPSPPRSSGGCRARGWIERPQPRLVGFGEDGDGFRWAPRSDRRRSRPLRRRRLPPPTAAPSGRLVRSRDRGGVFERVGQGGTAGAPRTHRPAEVGDAEVRLGPPRGHAPQQRLLGRLLRGAGGAARQTAPSRRGSGRRRPSNAVARRAAARARRARPRESEPTFAIGARAARATARPAGGGGSCGTTSDVTSAGESVVLGLGERGGEHLLLVVDARGAEVASSVSVDDVTSRHATHGRCRA